MEWAATDLDAQLSGHSQVMPAVSHEVAPASGKGLHLFGKGTGSYLHSNHVLYGNRHSWGSRREEYNWSIEFDRSTPQSGMEVHLQGRTDGAYLLCDMTEGQNLSMGPKDASRCWIMEWEGELTTGSAVHLRAKANPNLEAEYKECYLHSNAAEGDGASWGSRRDDLNWVVEFTEQPQPQPSDLEHAERGCGDAQIAPGASDDEDSDTQFEELAQLSADGVAVFLFGKGTGRYWHSNHVLGDNMMSWGSDVLGQIGPNEEAYNWVLERAGPVRHKEDRHRVDIHIQSRTNGSYLYSDAAEGARLSMGPRDGNKNWTMEWTGQLNAMTHIHLKARQAKKKFFHSTASEGEGMAWGKRHSPAGWILHLPAAAASLVHGPMTQAETDLEAIKTTAKEALSRVGHEAAAGFPAVQARARHEAAMLRQSAGCAYDQLPTYDEARAALDRELQDGFPTPRAAAQAGAVKLRAGVASAQEALQAEMAQDYPTARGAVRQAVEQTQKAAAVAQEALRQLVESGAPQAISDRLSRDLAQVTQHIAASSPPVAGEGAPASPAEDAAFRQSLAQLAGMGFPPEESYRQLVAAKGNVALALDSLLAQEEAAEEARLADPAKLQDLRDMGFEEDDTNREALYEARGEVKDAVKLLVRWEREGRAA